jgi:hypothetical protein
MAWKRVPKNANEFLRKKIWIIYSILLNLRHGTGFAAATVAITYISSEEGVLIKKLPS